MFNISMKLNEMNLKTQATSEDSLLPLGTSYILVLSYA